MFRSIRLFAFGALTALSLIASSAVTAQSPVLDRVVKTNTLRVGMSANQPPLNVKSKSGQMIGLEVDLANGLAYALGLELEIVQKPFGKLLGALKRGQVDMVMSGVDITAARTKDFLFVGPYLLSGKSLVTTSKALAGAETVDDINQPGVTFVALKNSTSHAFVKKNISKAKLVGVDTYEDGVAMVIEGKASAMIADMPACFLAVLRNPDAGLVTLEEPLSVEPMGIAVSAKDMRFYNLIDNYIEAIEATGILSALRAKWFEDPSWLDELP
ncbi:MAG: transporter substrate-binding domain-containing protein [Deltaproteobacteria bacterium]|nr:transporter substrate-binding domain-containing protein [Deltaproteobacteria bacterium]NND29354.1 transporter substrate-binding domain-containing protein [Myxococcales bacterium]MBT8463408.1 transporter substrate-binding domain-containing protein [Deltaproteobacteria bacterium]MBT8480702.1 transporter substrate-binding domain-containing protein [Deltaproteobacteria bacterium]NNK09432.1 transporter substrate-binding domain-containing protein [Myxococcales bacterium]